MRTSKYSLITSRVMPTVSTITKLTGWLEMQENSYSDDMTLGDAQQQFFGELWNTVPPKYGGKGGWTTCPTCTRDAKMHRRPLHSGMVRSLIRVYREHGKKWYESRSTKEREESKLAWWGLLEREKRGIWRVTDKGERFLKGVEKVSEAWFEFAAKPRVPDGPQVSVRRALGKKFDYDELMNG